MRAHVIRLCLMAGLTSFVSLAQPSPAESAIAEAKAAIDKNPSQSEHYNALGFALARRARETADGKFYDQASEAAQKSLELSPDNLEARKLQTWLLLGKHEFAKALELAKELNRRSADDPVIYGFLVDAFTELGQYEEAEKAAQWMLDLRRAGVPGLTRAAYLREIFGDIDGSAELMLSAYNKIDSKQVEDRAWILTHLAHLRLITGQLEEAEKLLNEAFALFPGYHYTRFQMAKLRTMQGKHAEAADLLRERYRSAPHPENLFDLAQALKQAGRSSEAETAFKDFEKAALRESRGADNANRELVFYYSDFVKQPAAALEIARLEETRRRDILTLDALAWALHRNGQRDAARQQIEAVLKVGVRDPKIFYHAGAIAWEQKDYDAASRYLSDSVTMNSRSEVAAKAKALLAKSPKKRSAR